MLFQRPVKYYWLILSENLAEAVGLRNIITDRINLSELQVDDISEKTRYGRKYEEVYIN